MNLHRSMALRAENGGLVHSVPHGERIYAIGDVHGRMDLLCELMAIIRSDYEARASHRVRILLLGDIVDRGDDSADLVAFCQEQTQRSADFMLLKGNHEAMMVQAYRGSRTAMRVWLSSGGAASLYSWGVDHGIIDDGDPVALLTAMRRKISESVIAWLDALPTSHEAGDYFFVHAGVRPGIPLHRQRSEDMLWIGEEFTNDLSLYHKMIVHGHSERDGSAEVLPNRIGIDTGAYRTDILTALAIEGSTHWILQTRGQADMPDTTRVAVPLSLQQQRLREDVNAILERSCARQPTEKRPGGQSRRRDMAMVFGVAASVVVAAAAVLMIRGPHAQVSKDHQHQVADNRVNRAPGALPQADIAGTAPRDSVTYEAGDEAPRVEARSLMAAQSGTAQTALPLAGNSRSSEPRPDRPEADVSPRRSHPVVSASPQLADSGAAADRREVLLAAQVAPDTEDDRNLSPSSIAEPIARTDGALAFLLRDRALAESRRRQALDLIRSLRRQ